MHEIRLYPHPTYRQDFWIAFYSINPLHRLRIHSIRSLYYWNITSKTHPFVLYFSHYLCSSISTKGIASHQQIMQYDSTAPNIRFRVIISFDAFRWQILRGPNHLFTFDWLSIMECRSKPKVYQFYVDFFYSIIQDLFKDYVLEFYITMHDIFGMHVLQGR